MHTVYRAAVIALAVLGLEVLSIWGITLRHRWRLDVRRDRSDIPLSIEGQGQLLSLRFSKQPESISFFELFLEVDHVEEHRVWGFDFRRTVMRPDWYDVEVQVAFAWLAFLPLSIPALAAIRLTYQKVTRPKQGLCARCGYDLRASPDRCPECGTAAQHVSALKPI